MSVIFQAPKLQKGMEMISILIISIPFENTANKYAIS